MNRTYLCVVINSYNSCMIHGDCRVFTIWVFRSVTNTLLYLFHNALDHNDSSALPGHFTRTFFFLYSYMHFFILIKHRYTISGGRFTIQNPNEYRDGGSFQCVASNKYGSVVSQPAEFIFGSKY